MVRSVTGKSYEIDEILEILGQHEDQLIYPSFDETTDKLTSIAWELGNLIRQRFIREKRPLGLNGNLQIRASGATPSGDCLIYFASVLGAIPPGNATLIAGKAAVVTFSGRSSFLNRLNMKRRKVELKEFGLDSPRHFLHGGAFPIRVRGCSMPVAIAVVSGMPDMADGHQIVVDSIEEHLALIQSNTEAL